MKDYRVIFLSDSHLNDWEGMFGMSSEERLRFGIDAVLKEEARGGRIDAVILPGDFCNNVMQDAYPAGEFHGIPYAAGCSGSDKDPQGEARLARFRTLMQPIYEKQIPVYAVNGNHDICSHLTFEKAFRYTEDPCFLLGGSSSSAYPKGYGKNYAVKLNDETAFIFFDVFDGENAGFTVNGSGKNWGETAVPEEIVRDLFAATESFAEVFVVAHWLRPDLQGAILREIEARPNVKAAFVGHSHMETVKEYSCGKKELTCGYLGVPMYERQKLFQSEPFSYRVLERKGNRVISFIALMEKDYPAYTFTPSSKASIEAFYQPYLRRPETVIEE